MIFVDDKATLSPRWRCFHRRRTRGKHCTGKCNLNPPVRRTGRTRRRRYHRSTVRQRKCGGSYRCLRGNNNETRQWYGWHRSLTHTHVYRASAGYRALTTASLGDGWGHGGGVSRAWGGHEVTTFCLQPNGGFTGSARDTSSK